MLWLLVPWFGVLMWFLLCGLGVMMWFLPFVLMLLLWFLPFGLGVLLWILPFSLGVLLCFPCRPCQSHNYNVLTQPLPVLIRKAFFLVPSLGWSLPLYLRWLLSPPGLRRPLRSPWFPSIKRFLCSRSRPFPWCAPRRRPRWWKSTSSSFPMSRRFP